MSTQLPPVIAPVPLRDVDAYSEEFWKEYYDKVEIDDGEPVDGDYSECEMRLLAGSLNAFWAGPGQGRPFSAFANVGLFYSPELPPIVPDVMVSLDIRRLPRSLGKKSQSYFVWEFRKIPDLALEIVSNAKGGEDTLKLEIYQKIGIPYYVIHDPEEILSDKVVRAYFLEKGTYQLRDKLWFPRMNLGLTTWEGSLEGIHETWLRWIDADGSLIPSAEEAGRRAVSATQQAEQARHHAELAQKQEKKARQDAKKAKHDADKAKQDAEQARLKAEQLAAKLRALGINPDE